MEKWYNSPVGKGLGIGAMLFGAVSGMGVLGTCLAEGDAIKAEQNCQEVQDDYQTCQEELKTCQNDLMEAKDKKNPLDVVIGKIIHERTGIKGSQDIPFRAYIVKDEKSGKHYAGIFEGHSPDPFNVGDCVKLTLGEIGLIGSITYIDNELIDEGRIILKYESCPEK